MISEGINVALSRIATLFPEVVHSPVKTLVDEPGWLYAQCCDTWWKGSEDVAPTTVLLVYRSPLVTETSRLYRPVAEMFLRANRVDVIGKGTRPHENWMGERGEFLVARMTQAKVLPAGPLDMREVRNIMSAAVDEALGRVLVGA